MKKHITLLLAILMAMAVTAQTDKKVKTVTLKTGVVLNYEEALQDSVRIVFTPEGDTLGLKIYLKDTGATDYLYSQIDHVEFGEGQPPVVIDQTNENKNSITDLAKNSEGWRLEFPRFYQGNNVTFEISHSDSQYGITYSLEWDGTLKANRWTCYQLHSGNMEKNVKRKDAFACDPQIPSPYCSTLDDYNGQGYDRGHLCPSGDRLCSKEQNRQTFYLSNMQPQIHGHNSGVWSQLEQKVRDTWAPQNNEDTLYVVKAATIDSANIKTHTSSGLIVPKYFYMALLYYNKSANTYTAMGVWSPHETGSQTEYIAIDELEKRTGIDFFCNLPDAIENEVERNLDQSYWKLSAKRSTKR